MIALFTFQVVQIKEEHFSNTNDLTQPLFRAFNGVWESGQSNLARRDEFVGVIETWLIANIEDLDTDGSSILARTQWIGILMIAIIVCWFGL